MYGVGTYEVGIKCFRYVRTIAIDISPDPTPRIASVHKSRFAEVVLVGCWMEAVYYCLLLRKR